MRLTAARWCSAHLDLACQAISMLQVICVREKYTQGKTLSRGKVDGEVDYRE